METNDQGLQHCMSYVLMYDVVWIETFLSLLQHHMHLRITKTTCGSHHTFPFCLPPHAILITPSGCPDNNVPHDLYCPITPRWYVASPPPSQPLHTSHTYVFFTHNPCYHCHQIEHFNCYQDPSFNIIYKKTWYLKLSIKLRSVQYSDNDIIIQLVLLSLWNCVKWIWHWPDVMSNM